MSAPFVYAGERNEAGEHTRTVDDWSYYTELMIDLEELFLVGLIGEYTQQLCMLEFNARSWCTSPMRR